MHRAALIGAIGLLGLVSVWVLRGSSPNPAATRPIPEVRDRGTRLATRPFEARPSGSQSQRAASSEWIDDTKAPIHEERGRQVRRSKLRPHDSGTAEVEWETAVRDRILPRPMSPPAAGQDTFSSTGQSEDGSGESDAMSAEEVVARDLGAVASFPLAQGQTANRGLAPAAEEDVTYDELGAFFGPLARFIIMPPLDLPSLAGTVSFWVLPAWTGEADTNAAYFQWRTNEFANRIQIFKNGPYLRFLIATNEGVESGVGVNVMQWKPGEWHAVTATWGDGVASLYIDGALAGAREYFGDIVIPRGTPWYVGSDHPEGAPGARSRVRGFQIYPRALNPDEVLLVVGATQPPA